MWLKTPALTAAGAACNDVDAGSGLKKFLKKNAGEDTLAVLDAKLGNIIKEKMGINCIFRCDRKHMKVF